MTDLADELVSQRAEDRIGDTVRVLVEEVGAAAAEPDLMGQGRAEHQGPEVDGNVELRGERVLVVGEFVDAVVVGSDGADLMAEVRA